MSRLAKALLVKRVLLAATMGATLLVLTVVTASATAGGRGALRSAGSHAVLLAGATGVHQSTGGIATSPTFSPMVINIGQRWTLHGKLLVDGTVQITCGPFLNNGFFGSQPSANVTVEEPVGDHVGHAQALIPVLNCDANPHSYAVEAVVNDAPFSPSAGVAIVNATACGTDPTTVQFVCQAGGTRVIQVSIQ